MAIVQRGHFGGTGGNTWRFQHPLTSITVYTAADGFVSGLKLVSGAIEQTYGTSGTAHTLEFGPSPLSTLEVWYGPQPGYHTDLVCMIKLTMTDGATFEAGEVASYWGQAQVHSGATFMGLAGNYGDRIDALGLLTETNDVEVQVSLNDSTVAVNTAGPIELREHDRISWTLHQHAGYAIEFDRLAFFTDAAEQNLIGNWTAAEGATRETGFLYDFESPSTTALQIVENAAPREDTKYWYALWVKSNGRLYKLDPEVFNFKKRPN